MSLTPSQRATLLKEISIRLGAESWPLIDVTLKQFSAPISTEWNGGSTDYVLRMLEDEPDQTLIDLGQHVGYQFEGEKEAPRIDPPFWRKGMLRLFVTHLATHRAFAGDREELELRVCEDTHGIPGSAELVGTFILRANSGGRPEQQPGRVLFRSAGAGRSPHQEMGEDRTLKPVEHSRTSCSAADRRGPSTALDHPLRG